MSIIGNCSFASNPVPVPAYDANYEPDGYWDLSDDDSLIFKSDRSGKYNLYDIDVLVARFIQRMQIYGSCYTTKSLESDDIEYLPPGYYFKIKVYNPENPVKLDGTVVSGVQTMRLWGTFFAYRQDTLP